MTIGHVYTLKQAAKLTGVSHSTIRRRQEEGAFPNMFKDSDGAWKIPLSDLEQAGIRPRSTERPQPKMDRSSTVTLNGGQSEVNSPTPPLTAPRDRTPELELAVENWREKAHQAERELSELRGYLRGVEGTLEESRLHNRELSARNQDLTRALIAIEEKVKPAEPVVLKEGEDYHLGREQPAPAPEHHVDHHVDQPAPTPRELWKQGRTLKEIAVELGITEQEAWQATRSAPADPAPKRGWRFWK